MTEQNCKCTDEIIRIGALMYQKGFVASNDGNISARSETNPEHIWMTPTGVSKGALTREMLLKLDLDGNIIEGGSYRKSTETGMHLRIYRENPSVMGVTHAHSPTATAFAVARIPLDMPIYPEALVIIGRVPVTEYAAPGTSGVAESVAPFVRDYNAVLLANHGPVSWGKTLNEAWFRLESLENFAKITLYSKYILGHAAALTEEQIRELGLE